jgi:signal transduction histidine kinase
VDHLTEHTERFRKLVEAGVAVGSELSLDALLQRTVEMAAALTGARYAALGVIDRSGLQLERFVTTGIDEETRAEIGSLPTGRGILGVLIREARPLRLTDLTADPRSVGFPPGHPPMQSFLGVPIEVRGVNYGNLYLTEKEGGAEFSDVDEELVTLLASQAAGAIEHVRLYEAATQWSRQMAALDEIMTTVTEQRDLSKLLELTARRLRELIGARRVLITLPGPDRLLKVVAEASDDAATLLGSRIPDDSKARLVFERRRSERVDSLLDDPEVDQGFARRAGGVAGLFVPLVVRDRALGVMVAFNKAGADPRFGDADVRVAEAFARRAAVAVEVSQRVARETVQAIVEGQELERGRLARELHDETGQALTSILLGLGAIDRAATLDEARQASTGVRELAKDALENVRRLAVELRPAALDDFGLAAALERLAGDIGSRSEIEVDFRLELANDERLPANVETTVYRIAQEAFTNVIKHAHASRLDVVLARREHSIMLSVRDDGRGFSLPDEHEGGFGLIGMHERVALVEGTLEIDSETGSGTRLVANIPVS